MELLYDNKIIVSICIGLFIAAIYYNYNKVDKEKNYKDYTILIFMFVSIMIYTILYKTQENINDVMGEIDVGEPDF
jgi:hypothetical protein|tara:strand:+ start:1267 stop:1494 length:228 start_codon:yes stop_codon:yes gene_type:complete